MTDPCRSGQSPGAPWLAAMQHSPPPPPPLHGPAVALDRASVRALDLPGGARSPDEGGRSPEEDGQSRDGARGRALAGEVRQVPPHGPDLRLIVDDLDSIVWELELHTMRFTMVSKQAERILGYPIERWLTEAGFWQEHLHPDDRATAMEYCAEETRKCRGHELEYRMIGADGRVVWLRDIVSVIAEAGQPIWLRGVMVDVTRQKLAEQERDCLLEQTREALRLREEFLAVAAHELRTPVNVLGLLLESLLLSQRRGDLELPSRYGRKVEQAGAQVGRLARLVATMLDVSTLPADALRLRRELFDLRDAARSSISLLAADSAAAGVEVRLADGPPVTGCWDRYRVEQLAVSLLSNAVKYGQGKPVDVEVFLDDRDAALVVRDRGIGIAAEDLERIFHRFERAVSLRSYGGLGLGLYVARRIARAHGGSIDVTSELGAGAAFVVRLPRSPTAGGGDGGHR